MVIGIDAACWEAAEPLIEEGALPNLERIRREGFWGELVSTYPPSSAPAWSSFITGTNPGKHGIFNFHNFKKGSYRLHLVNSRDIKSDKIWHIFNRFGKRVIVVHLPMTYPPDVVNSAMVTGMLTPSERATYTYPPELKDEIFLKFKKHPVEMPLSRLSGGSRHEAIRVMTEMTDLTGRVGQYLMKSRSWDVLILVFRATDLAQHISPLIDPRRDPAGASPPKYLVSPLVRSVYAQIDDFIGRFREYLGPEDAMVILSDHGATPGRKLFCASRWLQEEGYLRLKSTARRFKRSLLLRTITVERFLCRLGWGRMAQRLPEPLLERTFPIPWLAQRPEKMVDWGRTRVYPPWPNQLLCSLRVNLKGREPNGIVEPGKEFQNLCKELKEKLSSLRDDSTGEKIFEAVHLKEQIYHGPEIDKSADIIGLPAQKGWGIYNNLFVPEIVQKPDHPIGIHQMEGIILGIGHPFRSGHRLPGASIIDVAPTLLHLFGIPVPENMDGKILHSALKEDWKPEPLEPVGGEPMTPSEKSGYSREEEQRVIDKLRDLGYIS